MTADQYRARFIEGWRALGTRGDDIHVVTYPKSGTTWMQMILWHLTTDGHRPFEHIDDVSPWLRLSALTGRPLPEPASPRIIKWHENYEDVPSDADGRFIVVVRDGLDAIVSFAHQRAGRTGTPVDCSGVFDARIDRWAEHVAGWRRNQGARRVLYVRYEDLIADVGAEIDRVVQFLEIRPLAGARERAVEQTRFDRMRQLDARFGPQRTSGRFMRAGRVGDGALSLEPQHVERYRRLLASHFGGDPWFTALSGRP